MNLFDDDNDDDGGMFDIPGMFGTPHGIARFNNDDDGGMFDIPGMFGNPHGIAQFNMNPAIIPNILGPIPVQQFANAPPPIGLGGFKLDPPDIN